MWDDAPDCGGVGARRLVRAAGGSLGAGEITARVLIVAAHADPDVAEYPETGKVAAIVHGEHRFHRLEDAVEHAGAE